MAKTKQELEEIKRETEELKEKLSELSADELEQVAGGLCGIAERAQ